MSICTDDSCLSLPELILEKDPSLQKECYLAHLEAKKLHLRASSAMGFSFAKKRMAIELASKRQFWRSSLQAPSFSLRPFFLQKELVNPSQELLEELKNRIVDFGMNAICLIVHKHLQPKDLSFFRESGLRLILASQDLSVANSFLEPGDYWLFRANPKESLEKLLLERLVQEQAELACQTKASLIYDISAYPKIDPLDLSYQINEKTLLAFNGHENGKLHPFFTKICCGQIVIDPLFLVLFDIDIFGQGLWPCLPIETIKALLQWMEPGRFVGLMSAAKSPGRRNSYVDASLWTLGQSLWAGNKPDALLSSYLAAYQKPLDLDLLKEAEALLFCLRALSKDKERLRLQAAALLARINLLKAEDTGVFRYFFRDLKKELYYHLKQASEVLPQIFEGDDLGPSFWAKATGPASTAGRLGAAPSVQLLEEPFAPTEEMQAIFQSSQHPGF